MKKRLLPALLALCMVLALFPATALAVGETAEKHDVSINVVDAEGNAIDGATVKVTGDPNETYTVTGDTSPYTVNVYNVANDTYTVTVSKDGYTAKDGKPEATATFIGSATEVEVTLVKIVIEEPTGDEETGTEVTVNETTNVVTAAASDGKVEAQFPAALQTQLSGATIAVQTKAKAEVSHISSLAAAVKTAAETLFSKTSAVTCAAVTVTSKDGDEVTFGGANTAEITITINVGKAGKFHVFCITDSGMTNCGAQTTETGKITFKTKHLTDFPVVEYTAETEDAINALVKALGEEGVDNGVTVEPEAPTTGNEPGNTPAVLTVTAVKNTTGMTGWYTVTVDHMVSGKTYIVRIATDKLPSANSVLYTAVGETMTFQCKPNMLIRVYEIEGAVDWTNLPTETTDAWTK